MSVLRILIMMLAGTVLPVCVGKMYLPGEKSAGGVLFSWVGGQMTLWAVFLCVCIPMVLLEKPFALVMAVYAGATALCCILSLIISLRRGISHGSRKKEPGKNEKGFSRTKLFWGIFGALVLLQLVLLCVLAYEEGDDAYYVGVTTASKDWDALYMKDPYTGNYVGLDARHALAPMPVWVSVMAWIGGVSGATASHILLPILLVLMTYGIFYLLGERLLSAQREKLSLYMVFMALLVLFGGYSLYSSENFLLVRTAQGKAILANVVIPFLLYLLLWVLERVDQGKKPGFGLWVLLGMTMTAGCLCSTLGSLLLCILIFVATVCAVLCYGRYGLLLPMGACMLVPMGIIGMYLVL